MTEATIGAQPRDLYYDPFDYAIDIDPHPVWRRMRDEAPVYYNERYDFWALSRFDDVCSASRDTANLSSAHGTVLDIMTPEAGLWGPLLLFADPPDHTRLRKVVRNFFTAPRIAELEDRVTAIAASLLDEHVGSDGFDYVEDFAATFPSVVMCTVLGLGAEYADELRRSVNGSHHIDEAGPPIVVDENGKVTFPPPKIDNAHRDFASLTGFDSLVAERRLHPRDDILSELLIATTDSGDGDRPLTPLELVTFVSLMASAGVETVARLLSFAAVILGDNPHQRAVLAAEPDLLANAVEELLRYEAPSPVNARWVNNDVQFHGVTVPAGSKLLLLNGSAGRDEREFESPDVFDINRPIQRHVAFGYGAHFCLGAALARIEARVALRETLTRFPTWEVDRTGVVPVHTAHVRGFHRVPITFA
jgi:cytochrome P450